MKKLQEQGDKISGVLESMEKKSSAAVPGHGSIYEKFYAGNAIIERQVLTQNDDLFNVIIVARLSCLNLKNYILLSDSKCD